MAVIRAGLVQVLEVVEFCCDIFQDFPVLENDTWSWIPVEIK